MRNAFLASDLSEASYYLLCLLRLREWRLIECPLRASEGGCRDLRIA